MATISDQLLLVTVLAYLLAMVLHAAEYAFTTRPPRGESTRSGLAMAPAMPAGAAVPAIPGAGAQPAGTGSGGSLGNSPAGGVDSADDAATDRPDPARDWSTVGRLGQLAVASLVLAATVHLATAVTRGLAADRLPWGNMYEYALSATFIALLGWGWLLYRRPGIRHLGLYVALANVVLLGLVGMVAYSPVEPLQPSLDSAWFLIHVGAAAFASGGFLIGFVTAAMYLIRAGYERGKRRFPYPLGAHVPAAAAVERLTFRVHAFAFPIWTFAVVAGSIWAEAAWGRYWAWDPKEAWAFIAWVIYAGYLHARATPSVKRTVVAWLAIAGWLAIMMNLWGVNLFFPNSLHSYA